MKTAVYSSRSSHLEYKKMVLPCYILDSGECVFDKAGIQKAMGYSGKSQDWLSEFLHHIDRYAKIPVDILESIVHNEVFADGTERKSILQPNLLLDACKIIARAKDSGFLFLSEIKYAKAAALIAELLEKTDPDVLIEYATGFLSYKLNYKEAVGRTLPPECGGFVNWIKSFSDEHIEFFHHLRNTGWTESKEVREIAALIYELIYLRLPISLLTELEATKPRRQHARGFSVTKYLIHPNLQHFVQEIITLYNTAEQNENTFRLLLEKIYPKVQHDNLRKVQINPQADSQFTEIVQQVIAPKLN